MSNLSFYGLFGCLVFGEMVEPPWQDGNPELILWLKSLWLLTEYRALTFYIFGCIGKCPLTSSMVFYDLKKKYVAWSFSH